MKNTQVSAIITALYWSLFTGIIIISIGIGAVFPVINQISAPLICRGGHLQDAQNTYHPAPGTTTITITWYCVNAQTGEEKEISPLLMAPVAGTIYGLVIFVIAMVVQTVKASRHPASIETRNKPIFHPAVSMDYSETAKLKKLKDLLEAGLITQEDYDQKKAEILKQL
jgi:hypothetical protein